MTRITIEVDSSGEVTTSGSSPVSSGSLQEAPMASTPGNPHVSADPFANAINAGGAPDHSGNDGPMLFHGAPSSEPMSVPGAISAGPAPAGVFQASQGGQG